MLDASVTLSWCLGDEQNELASSVLKSFDEDEAIVPSIWPVEVSNALVIAERRKRISASQSTKLISFLTSLPVSVLPSSLGHNFETVFPLARAMHISCYDATYLDLAMREDCPMATLDGGMRGACEKVGGEGLGVILVGFYLFTLQSIFNLTWREHPFRCAVKKIDAIH